MTGRVVIKNRMGQFIKENQTAIEKALDRMGKDVKMIARIKAPYKSGELQDKIENKKRSKLQHYVEVDSPYASYQERGMRRDGTRIVRNYTTMGTGKNFLKNAGDQVTKDAVKYFRQAVHTIRLGL